MTDTISQVQATFEPLEDRIQLNITTQSHQVFSAWITRRYLKLLIPALQGKHPLTKKALLSDEAMRIMTLQENGKDARSANFETFKVDENAEYPLGKKPIILAKIAFKALNTDAPMMELNPEQGAGLAIPYNTYVLKLMLNVLEQALQLAAWDLEQDESLALPIQLSLH